MSKSPKWWFLWKQFRNKCHCTITAEMLKVRFIWRLCDSSYRISLTWGLFGLVIYQTFQCVWSFWQTLDIHLDIPVSNRLGPTTEATRCCLWPIPVGNFQFTNKSMKTPNLDSRPCRFRKKCVVIFCVFFSVIQFIGTYRSAARPAGLWIGLFSEFWLVLRLRSLQQREDE